MNRIREFALQSAVSSAANKSGFCRRKGGFEGGRGQMGIYVNEWLLALQGCFELGLGENYFDVTALDVASDGDGQIQVADLLGPFVGESGLFFCLACFQLFVFLGALFGGGRGGHSWKGVAGRKTKCNKGRS